MFIAVSRTAVAVVLAVAPLTPSIADPAADPAASVTPEAPVSSPADAGPAATPEASASAAPATIKLPALTGLELVVVEEVTSKTAVTGMPVQLRLSRPLYVAAELGIPAGTPVEGVVIHAAKGGMGGKSGELLLGAKRIILSDTVSIPLRSFRLGPAKGQNNEGLAMGVAIAGGAIGSVASMFITGGSATVPPGTVANAKTQADVEIPVTLLSALPPVQPIVVTPAPAAPAPASQPSPTQGENE